MAENPTEVAVGAGVIALALGFLVYAGQVTGFGVSAPDHYRLTASFRSAEGISTGTDVRLAGSRWARSPGSTSIAIPSGRRRN